MTQTPPAKSPLEFVLHQLNTPDCNSLPSEIPNIGAQLPEEEAIRKPGTFTLLKFSPYSK